MRGCAQLPAPVRRDVPERGRGRLLHRPAGRHGSRHTQPVVRRGHRTSVQRRWTPVGESVTARLGARIPRRRFSARLGSLTRKRVRAARSVRQGGRIATATVAVMAAMWGTAAASASAGVVALWHMDERSGTSMLDSAGGHTGMLHSVSLGVAGFLGTAYGFGSGYVSVPAASDLNPGGNTLTITIHAKTTQAPSSPDWDLIRKGLYTTKGREFKMGDQPSAQASCGLNGPSGYATMTAGPMV